MVEMICTVEANVDVLVGATDWYGADIHAESINGAVKNSTCDQNVSFVIKEQASTRSVSVLSLISIGVEIC